MESETPKLETKVAEKKETANINTSAAGDLVPVGSEKAQWQEAIEPVNEFISTLPQTINAFLSDYKQILSFVVYGAAGLVTVYLTIAVLNAIDDIPLLAPFFELVGLGYSIWFGSRCITESSRKELFAEIGAIKENIVGKKSEEK